MRRVVERRNERRADEHYEGTTNGAVQGADPLPADVFVVFGITGVLAKVLTPGVHYFVGDRLFGPCSPASRWEGVEAGVAASRATMGWVIRSGRMAIAGLST